MHFAKLIKLQIIKQVAETKGKDVKTIKLNKCLPATIFTDFLIGQFLVSPLLTMCWRSAWTLGDVVIDQGIFPGNKTLGIVLSLTIGTCLTILLRFVILVPSQSSIPSIVYFTFSRLFTVIYFCSYMMLWRGWWSLLIIINGPNSLVLGIGIFNLVLFGSLATNVGPPLAVSHDTRSLYLKIPICNHFSSTVVNILLTSIVEVFSILCWFATWTLTDSLLSMITSNYILDILLSLCIGFFSGFTAFSLQFPLFVLHKSFQSIAQRQREDPKLLSRMVSKVGSDILSLCGLISTVTSLRAYWMFIDRYIFPDHQLLSVLVPGLVGLLSLVVLSLSSTLHGGVVCNRETVGLWQGWYFTYWLVRERKIDRDRQGVDRKKCGHRTQRDEFSDGEISQEMDLFMRI